MLTFLNAIDPNLTDVSNLTREFKETSNVTSKQLTQIIQLARFDQSNQHRIQDGRRGGGGARNMKYNLFYD